MHQVQAELYSIGQSVSPVPVIVWAVPGATAAVPLGMSTVCSAQSAVSDVVVLYAFLLVEGAPSLVAVSFAPGKQLDNGLGMSLCNYPPWAWPLYPTSLVAIAI